MIRYNAYRGCHTPDRPLGVRATTKRRASTQHAKRIFTAEEDAMLSTLREQGLRWDEIGERFGRTATACRNRHAKLRRQA